MISGTTQQRKRYPQREHSEKKPNFFIVGAPKCGTTALSEYLRGHPNIFMSNPKEPMYFAKDILEIRGLSQSLQEYLELFQHSTDEHLAIGEATVMYLISSVAISNIYTFNKNAKIIVMLRNPIDMVQSLHSQMIYSLLEDELDFEKAWRLQNSRRCGKNLPKNSENAFNVLYKEFARYGDQMERLFNIFPREQVKVILFDDFKKSTLNVYNDVLAFLEVPPDGRTVFSIINKNKIARVWRMHYFIAKIIDNLDPLGRKIKKVLGLKSFGIEKLIRLNTRPFKPKPITSSFRAELVNGFRDDVEKLSYLLNKDLSYWLK